MEDDVVANRTFRARPPTMVAFQTASIQECLQLMCFDIAYMLCLTCHFPHLHMSNIYMFTKLGTSH